MDDTKPRLAAVLFDMDGTVINNEPAWRRALRKILTQLGIASPTEEQIEGMYSSINAGEIIAAKYTHEHILPDKSVDEILGCILAAEKETFSQPTEFTKGFEDFHKQLSNAFSPSSGSQTRVPPEPWRRRIESGTSQGGLKNCIATGGSRNYVELFKRTMKLEDFFGQHIYCRDDVGGALKPDPAVFLFAMEKLGATPDECIIFEDSLPGFEAAQAAGVKCIGIKTSRNQNLANHVEALIESFDEAFAILEKLFVF
jgi:beta-phosphoglucomutase-like phosphatase (HAD superfamily)